MDKNYGYKHTKWFLAFVIFTVLGFVVVANSQTASIDITGNLVNNSQTATTTTGTWQNAVFQSSLTCWAWGDPGYCGPNPIIRPSGDINFSYGMVDLHQKVNVGKALPYGGSGLVVTGFNFGWTSKNGNGWDDGRQDTLSAYVKLYSSGDTKVIESFNYNLNFLHDWTSFNWSANWVNTKVGYRENQVGNVQFGFIGKDNNYWAGPYGPEVNNVSFQLKYKPDPCKNNPLYSPECPNFTQELAKNTSTTTVDNPKTTSENYEPPPSAIKEPKQENQYEKETKYEEGYHEYDPTDRLVDTLDKIFENQTKEEKITMQASDNAIKQTIQQAQQTLKTAEKIAEKSTKDSIEISSIPQQSTTIEKDNRSIQSLTMFQPPTVISTGVFSLPGIQQNNTIHLNGQTQQSSSVLSVQEQGFKSNTSTNLFTTNSTQTTENTSNSASISLVNPSSNTISSVNNTNNIQISLLTNPTNNLVSETPALSSNFLTNRADPINSIIESKHSVESSKEQENKSVVKQNVQDSDVAAGVTIANIARTPIGFNSYLIALADVSFYPPRDVYRNQKNVDNVRALRQLASDRLHQQMVDQQYLPR